MDRFARLLPSEPVYTYVNDNFPSQLSLHLPTVGLALESGHPHFSLHADNDWGTLFPESSGFTDLGPNNRTFLVSFVHQLHCLDTFRVAFLTNRTGSAHHVEHCLRYMRQAVLCYADTTLEPAHPGMLNGKWRHGATGIGSVHRCKDWTALTKYLEDHPARPAEPPVSAVRPSVPSA
ncbi:hypothetical protein L226DRAFT_507565 [Lentinus tigrinus ALCF2SS1-7]|uniref:uncharacterized protein n=1 Tax=Lentinus tigrinus ALCF2SS1-7 TaxID=1328758 RepID=UPI0011661185|nr:hypothetical protein L226DRAFT_507565 [Lentinus tigrinus ALCF2SS1-7]